MGRKTANVVLNTAFGEPTMAVDTHIFRVANRTGLALGKTPLAVERKLLKSIPPEFLQDAHHWLILHGRYTCLARKPRCARMPGARPVPRRPQRTNNGQPRPNSKFVIFWSCNMSPVRIAVKLLPRSTLVTSTPANLAPGQ